jgi:hypothetical protein
MPEGSQRTETDGAQRRVTLLEAVAVAVIFTMVILVLYMIFIFRPA